MIFRNTGSMAKSFYFLVLYLYLLLKYYLVVEFLKINIKQQRLFGKEIYFDNLIQLFVGYREEYIWQQYDFKSKTESPVIFDCGAEIGMSSLYFKSVYPDAKITCFEPSPQAFKNLKKNLRGFRNIKLVNKALVGNNIKHIDLYNSQKEFTHTHNSSIYPDRWEKNDLKKIRVETTKLSSFIKSHLDLLKIDVEGAEDEIFDDLDKNHKLKYVDKIIFEYHRCKKGSLNKIVRILTKNGFDFVLGNGVRSPYYLYENKLYSILIEAYRD